MKILYIENHAPFIAAAKRQFLKDHDLEVVPSIAQAIESYQQGTFDLVLSDYDLEDGKGSEAVKRIRESNHQIPIIAVSSHSKGNEAMLEAGANAKCAKMNFAHINKVITQVVRAV